MIERQGIVTELNQVANATYRITIGEIVPTPTMIRAGQFVSVRIGQPFHPRRSFSLTRIQTNPVEFGLSVRIVRQGGVAEWVRYLKRGSAVRFTGPMGYFLCDRDHTGDSVLVATGAGISATRAMALELLQAGNSRTVQLYWGLRSRADVFDTNELDDWQAQYVHFSYHVALSVPDDDWKGLRGPIAPQVLADASIREQPLYYLCGHRSMIDAFRDALATDGAVLPIRAEAFY